MKLKLNLLAGALAVGCLAQQGGAQPAPPVASAYPSAPGVPAMPSVTADHPTAGAETQIDRLIDIEVRNFQDERLGRVRDLGIDLVNGRIVEVMVATGGFLGIDEKFVAVPPLALVHDSSAGVYRLNISAEDFKAAPKVDLSKWNDVNHGRRVAAAYRLFGQEPYFLEEGAAPSKTPGGHPKVPMGYVERSSKMLDLPVINQHDHKLGHVWSLSLDITRGRILNVVVLAPDDFMTRSMVPAMALSFNEKRDGLVLDDTRKEFAAEPRYFLTEGLNGRADTVAEEPYKGPHTMVALVQGSSNRDMDRTKHIIEAIRAAKIDERNLEVGTNNGRVTLRGWVANDADRLRIGEIAAAQTNADLVDNQIVVGEPIAQQ
jgi:sporulation protein YlmC with PRC-barrel domain